MGEYVWLAPLVAFLVAAIGWLFRELHFRREWRSKATLGASQILKDKKTLIEEMMAEIDDDRKKEELRLQLDEVNIALLGLHSERLRRTLKDAGLPPEEALIADGLSQLQPQQVDQLKGEIAELQTLPQPGSIWDLLPLGNAYYYAEQYEDAKRIYDRILSLNPDDPNILHSRGVTYGQLERYDEALADLNRSLELRPDDPATLYNRGVTYGKLERDDEALADYNRSLQLRPDDPATLNNRGVIYAKLERYDEALAEFNRSLELRPDHPATLYNRGGTYGKLERYDEALADYNRSLELKPDDPATLNNRGNTYAKLERYDEALADYNRSLELRPDDPAILYNLACLFSLQGKSDDALTYLEKAIHKDRKYREMAKTDKDFDNIRDDPRFKKLIIESD